MTLAEEFAKEQERLRDLLREYSSLGPVGVFGYAMISQVARRADAAALSGDPVEMLRVFAEMKECQ